MEQKKWRKFDGTLIKRDLQDEIRAVLVREKNVGHDLSARRYQYESGIQK